ncbi:hypothetical protein Taro_045828 [Colocasia esculenta]|uniref:Uncharacterized protein n=1 Tax=Colocasia esculenta TaxID=4460 RepID=A0A843X102_COLES|nr:hypothetical protein [Colocasia esculenta]
MVAMLRGIATWLFSRRTDPSRLGGCRFKTEFLVLVELVLRWCRPVRVGDMVVVLGARRRWSFRREGPNGSALLVELVWDAEVILRSSSRRSPASPFLTASLFVALEPLREARRGTVVQPDYGSYCSVTCVLPHSEEMWRQASPYLCYSPCGGHDEQSYGVSDRVVLSVPSLVSSFASALSFVGETSQQWQGVRRAKETGR